VELEAAGTDVGSLSCSSGSHTSSFSSSISSEFLDAEEELLFDDTMIAGLLMSIVNSVENANEEFCENSEVMLFLRAPLLLT
jgi:hypothetical protein